MNSALRKAQLLYDNAEPENNDAEREYIDTRAAELLAEDDTDGVSWSEFAHVASERVADADGDGDGDQFPVLRILLALRENKFDYAKRLHMQHFEKVICDCAENRVRHAMSKPT